MAAKRPIRIKKANRGKLRKAMGTKKGKKIPAAQLKAAKKKPPKGATKKQVVFAENARKWAEKRKKK